MRYSEVLSRLQNLVDIIPSQAELCRITKVKQSTMGNRRDRNSIIPDDEIMLINEHFGIDLYNETDTPTINLDYYPDVEVSCGNGILPFGETKEKMAVPLSLIKGYSKTKKYIIVNAVSDSMQPEIKPNDRLIMRVTENESILDNHIYIFCYNEHFYCKYLSYNVDQIIIRSANIDYPTRYIDQQNINDFRLCGEVCGLIREF